MQKFKKYDIYIYILIAYIFSFAMRYFYIIQVGDNSSFFWNNQVMLNTNDGYFWLSGIKNLIDHTMSFNQRVPGVEYGLVYFTYILSKVLPFSIDTIALYMPAFISSLVVIPIILIMRLFNLTFLGFLAALLASITWSFYNRTMIGYYDTDLFAIIFPVFIVYFLIKSIKNDSLNALLIASLLNSFYFYAYDASKPVVYGIGIGYIIYRVYIYLTNINSGIKYNILLISASMLDIDWRVRLALVFAVYVIAYKDLIKKESYKIISSAIFVILFFYLNNVFGIIWGKIYEYIATGVAGTHGLKFYQVHQTIREAGSIPFETFANRISGSTAGFILSIIGYILLVIRKKEFLLFLPLIGIGFFAYSGGLRFTVYAIPAMAIAVIYLFWEIAKYINDSLKIRYILVIALTGAILYPNIQHLIKYGSYSSPVFSKNEVEDLDKLRKISTPKDYTLTWWDYGYPIWYYSDTNTLIDGGKHQNDNYVVSQIMQTTSPQLAYNLSILSVEKYANEKLKNSAVIDKLIRDSKLKPNEFLLSLENKNYKLPKKTRDIYLYMPNRMINIFPTVMVFGNLDLATGKPLRKVIFYPSGVKANKGGEVKLYNGLIFDTNKGEIYFGSGPIKVKYFVMAQNSKNDDINLYPNIYHKDGSLAVVYLKSYGKIIIMDLQTFKSNYVQMGLLGNYDKDLFELVVKSPYSRIYKLKK